jgi:pimeloyl-ACP methyl ester carboxylesterase
MNKKKILKRVLIGIPLLFIAAVIFVIASSYIDHRKLVAGEKSAYPAPGMLLEVNDNGDRLHVYAEGSGNARTQESPTLVFLSGFGTSSPLYDFKALYSRLSDEYRIVVVERAGYGWSDISSSPRDIDTVLQESRTALQLAGEEPPYVLFPHSMAGLEALRWAHLYPGEVETIIGLDPLVPGYYELTEEKPSISPLLTFLARTGLMRSQDDVCRNNFPAIKKGHLTEEETEIACTLFFRRNFTKNMWNEADMLPANSRTVLEQGPPSIPFHAFISGKEDEKWKETVSSYARNSAGEHYILDADHYIHLDEPETIAGTSRRLIKEAMESPDETL